MRLALFALEGKLGDESTAAMLYWRAKRGINYLETNGLISIRLVQAALLVAYYEISNAIYPAAFMSVAFCARLGHALGIHDPKHSPQLHNPRTSIVEYEEARRTWWGVLILDRYVAIGPERRPFSCPDADPDTLLPMDEGSWESGEPKVRPSLAVSAQIDSSACPFARACQAANLLSRALRHINDRPDDYEAWYQEALLLARVVSAFGSAVAHEAARLSDTQVAPLLPALGLAYSAQMALFDMHSCVECQGSAGCTGISQQLEMQQVAIEGLQRLNLELVSLARRVCRLLSPGGGVRAVSPLVLDCFYQIAKQQSWFCGETGRPELFDHLCTVKEALRAAGRTWVLANEYLTILDGDGLRPLGPIERVLES